MFEFASVLLGKLNWQAFQHPLITEGAALSMVGGVVVALALVTYYKKWPWLWREWLTTTNHKKIGVMYLIVATLMLIRGGADALMMRAQQATSVGSSNGVLSANTFQQVMKFSPACRRNYISALYNPMRFSFRS